MKAGVHTSIAGGFADAARLAKRFGCDTFQIFSGNPRGWRTLDLAPLDCERFREASARYQQSPIAVHANYLINLAATDSRIHDLSVAAAGGKSGALWRSGRPISLSIRDARWRRR